MLFGPECQTTSARGWTRREALALLAAALLGGAACSRPKSRAEVVRTLTADLAKEDLDALLRVNAKLVESVERLVNAPGGAELTAARESFREALLAWETAACFPNLALTRSHAPLRARFWPVREASVQKLLVGSDELSAARVNELGVDRKGLFALEWLLFPAPGSDEPAPVELSGTPGERARALSLAYAQNVATCAERVPRGQPEDSADANTRLIEIVGHMSTTLGSIASGRLSHAFEPGRAERSVVVRGLLSGTSISILQTLVAGTERVYRGPSGVGLGTLVAEAAPEVDEHLRALFQAARVALTRAGEPGASPLVLASAQAGVRNLDVALEVELPSALGITLLFGGADAD